MESPGPLTVLVVLVTVGVIVAAVWWLPAATAPSATVSDESGGERSFRWPVDRDRTQELRWTSEVNVTDDPAHVEIYPGVPFTIEACRPWGAPVGSAGASDLWTTFAVMVNDQKIGEHILGIHVVQHEPRGCTTLETVEGIITRQSLEPAPLVRGSNRVEASVLMEQTVSQKGTGYFDVSLGPLRIELSHSDRGDDGIRDSVQPVPELHAGVTSIGLAVPAAVASWWLVGRRKQQL